MDEQTALVLSLQLIALLSIAGALLSYLLCKIRGNSGQDSNYPGAGKSVLITSCGNTFGLQIALHLANRGFRVFAGLKEAEISGDHPSSRVITDWQKGKESLSASDAAPGTLIVLPVDVTREDILHESVDLIKAHLPAGDGGIWSVINTTSICYRGRLDQQDITHWETMLKINVIGALRVARTYQGLLSNGRGRSLTIGAPLHPAGNLVAYTAAKHGAEGVALALRQELAAFGVDMLVVNFENLPPDLMLAAPAIKKPSETNDFALNLTGSIEHQPLILSQKGLKLLEDILTTTKPKQRYMFDKKCVLPKLPSPQ